VAENDGVEKTTSSILLHGASLLSITFLLLECVQVAVERLDYFKSGWNVMDITGHFGVLASTFFTVFYTPSFSLPSTVRAWTSVILWTGNLAYLRPYGWSGPLVRMVVQIVKDMIPFVVVLVVLMFGFVGGFASLLQTEDAFQGAGALLTVFAMMLGDFDIGNFEGNANSLGMFVLYMGLVVIVLLNLLIAIMGDSYDRVRENQMVEGLKLRAETLVGMDRLYGRFLELVARERCYPLVLHVLAPHGWEESGGGDEWEGRVKAIQRAVKGMDSKFEGMAVSSEVKALETKLNEMLSLLRSK